MCLHLSHPLTLSSTPIHPPNPTHAPNKKRYGHLTAANNHLYACRHGYAFLFTHITSTTPSTYVPPMPPSLDEEAGVGEEEVEEEVAEQDREPDKYLKGCLGKEGLRSAPYCKGRVG